MNKARKHYKQMHKKTIKNIKRILNQAGPWDYGFAIEILHQFLKEMQDYYTNGYNVDAFEPCRGYTRLEICNHLLELYENIDDDSKAFWSYFAEYYQSLWD